MAHATKLSSLYKSHLARLGGPRCLVQWLCGFWLVDGVVVADPSVTFTTLPEGCTVVPDGVDCILDTLLADSGGLVTESDTLPFAFEYSIADGTQLPVVFELSASSFENPVSNDPVPENNTLTIEAS